MVSAVNSVSVFSNYGVYSYSGLTQETKRRLEALGIDTKDIKTEAEGLRQLQIKEKEQSSKSTQYSYMNNLREQATSLANQLGVEINQNEKMSVIFDKISQKIAQMQESQNQSELQKAQAATFLSKYQSLYSTYSSQSNQNMLGQTLGFMADYNRSMLGF
ncbi:MAG: hypothetical protein PHV37_02435 [Candidatus Gastranaerophilales bacterium]|nr:hypothetical protein [Candidatus Gastranaerophilales bacterium]